TARPNSSRLSSTFASTSPSRGENWQHVIVVMPGTVVSQTTHPHPFTSIDSARMHEWTSWTPFCERITIERLRICKTVKTYLVDPGRRRAGKRVRAITDQGASSASRRWASQFCPHRHEGGTGPAPGRVHRSDSARPRRTPPDGLDQPRPVGAGTLRLPSDHRLRPGPACQRVARVDAGDHVRGRCRRSLLRGRGSQGRPRSASETHTRHHSSASRRQRYPHHAL